MEKLKVLITGASGLIGGIAIKQLGDKYAFSSLSRSEVKGVPHLSADIATSVEAIQPAFTGIHSVLHLAAGIMPRTALYEWPATMRSTIEGTLNVYEAARIAGVKRVVFFSSGMTQLAYEWDPGSVYGLLANGPDDQIPQSWPILEVDAPVRPDSPFSVGKLFGENLGRYYADKYGLSTLVVRSGRLRPDDRQVSQCSPVAEVRHLQRHVRKQVQMALHRAYEAGSRLEADGQRRYLSLAAQGLARNRPVLEA
jgi:nucleoside-diphosphate-sugar epimerase